MPKKPAKPKAAKSPRAKPVVAGAVTASISPTEYGVEAVLGAATLLTDRAYVRVDGDRERALTVTLVPKEPSGAAGLAALKADFEAELATQKLRWVMSKNNLWPREHVARQAVLLANGHPLTPAAQAGPAPSAAAAPDALTADQQAEIDRLIKEVEAEIKELKDKPAGADPDGVKATWEEKHGGGS